MIAYKRSSGIPRQGNQYLQRSLNQFCAGVPASRVWSTDGRASLGRLGLSRSRCQRGASLCYAEPGGVQSGAIVQSVGAVLRAPTSGKPFSEQRGSESLRKFKVQRQSLSRGSALFDETRFLRGTVNAKNTIVPSAATGAKQ
jgi:hypothetical protein